MAPRFSTVAALGVAGGVGYYLYQSGGSPKVAEKQFESDVHAASAKIRGELPGRAAEARKDAEKLGAQAGAKFDSAVSRVESEAAKAKAEAEAFAKDTSASTMKKVNEFDRKVEQEAAKAKSGISSWFGGK
ncbi:uncharacterized protein E0L32_000059 [Thyridium curvatum]|uniref:Calcofluor white hypersensitive protein n=1 Tax=Thyridium curvatum TaxID=1093900 RepID=A0A507AY59_9PEZI|nr:uncharacterized protein E0L32_000059 [Thyridium curvatum]TPX15725.1 hypothetical protein E0L32_000059 [Thyridium curvatum]